MAGGKNVSEGLELGESAHIRRAQVMLEFLGPIKYVHLNQYWRSIEEYWAEEWHGEESVLRSLHWIRARECVAMWRPIILLLI